MPLIYKREAFCSKSSSVPTMWNFDTKPTFGKTTWISNTYAKKEASKRL